MNAAPASNTPTQPSRLPPLPRRQRIGAAVASAVVSTVLLSGVVVGLTGVPDGASQMAAQIFPAARG